jgi:Ran GTPase-activating protein (RanGAP) involved in mRNA processing and transport
MTGFQDKLRRLEENDKTLTRWDLYNRGLGDGGAMAVAKALQLAPNSSLTKLFLSDNRIGNEGAKYLADALMKNSTLIKLDLDKNCIGDDGAEALAEVLWSYDTVNNTSLSYLDLHGNNIGDRGAIALAKALTHNRVLTLLRLSHNRIGEAGARALYEALQHNVTLELLEIYGNKAISKSLQMEIESIVKTNRERKVNERIMEEEEEDNALCG